MKGPISLAGGPDVGRCGASRVANFGRSRQAVPHPLLVRRDRDEVADDLGLAGIGVAALLVPAAPLLRFFSWAPYLLYGLLGLSLLLLVGMAAVSVAPDKDEDE